MILFAETDEQTSPKRHSYLDSRRSIVLSILSNERKKERKKPWPVAWGEIQRAASLTTKNFLSRSSSSCVSPILKTIQWIAIVLITAVHRSSSSFFFFIPYIVHCSKESREKKNPPLPTPSIVHIFFTHFHICISPLLSVCVFCPVNHKQSHSAVGTVASKFRKRENGKRAQRGIVTSKSRAALPVDVGKKHNGGRIYKLVEQWLSVGKLFGCLSTRIRDACMQKHAVGQGGKRK